MIYYPIKEPSGFKTFKTIRVLGENTYSGKITINEANEELAGLIDNILNFNGKARQKKRINEIFLILQKIFIKV